MGFFRRWTEAGQAVKAKKGLEHLGWEVISDFQKIRVGCPYQPCEFQGCQQMTGGFGSGQFAKQPVPAYHRLRMVPVSRATFHICNRCLPKFLAGVKGDSKQV